MKVVKFKEGYFPNSHIYNYKKYIEVEFDNLNENTYIFNGEEIHSYNQDGFKWIDYHSSHCELPLAKEPKAS